MGIFKEALEQIQVARPLCEKIGDRQLLAICDGDKGIIHARMGQWEEARVALERAESRLEKLQAKWVLPEIKIELAQALFELGNPDEAGLKLDDAKRMATESDMPHYVDRIEKLLESWRTEVTKP